MVSLLRRTEVRPGDTLLRFKRLQWHAAVAEQVAVMLNSCTAAVSRFDPPTNRGTIVGGWSDEGLDLGTVPYALDGVTASAEVSRTGRSARTTGGYASNADPLTGIANRRTFHERLTAEVARAERYGRHLSLALLDLDHFKAVNDLHGHQGGDRQPALGARRSALGDSMI